MCIGKATKRHSPMESNAAIALQNRDLSASLSDINGHSVWKNTTGNLCIRSIGIVLEPI